MAMTIMSSMRVNPSFFLLIKIWGRISYALLAE